MISHMICCGARTLHTSMPLDILCELPLEHCTAKCRHGNKFPGSRALCISPLFLLSADSVASTVSACKRAQAL